MTLEGWTLILGFVLLVAAIARPLGLYLDAVYAGRGTLLSPVLRPLERGFHALGGVKSDQEQDWKGYALALVAFTLSLSWLISPVVRSRYISAPLQSVTAIRPPPVSSMKPGGSMALNISANSASKSPPVRMR